MRSLDNETEQIVIVEDVTNSPRFVGLIAVRVSLIEQANTKPRGIRFNLQACTIAKHVVVFKLLHFDANNPKPLLRDQVHNFRALRDANLHDKKLSKSGDFITGSNFHGIGKRWGLFLGALEKGGVSKARRDL